MNAVEIEEAVSELAAAPFDAAEFPYLFLAAFGMKETTIARLRKGESNASDVAGGVLQRSNIHIAIAEPGEVGAKLGALRESPKTASAKAKFILATDGAMLEAEDLASGETIACDFPDFARHFGFFLPLAGISTVKEIKNNPVDIKATGRLNKLYVELLRHNPDWASDERRPALNQFMARLIFCFFAEDTGIFHGSYLFTPTLERMSEADGGNTHLIVGELFRAMGTHPRDRGAGGFRPWADGFPFVNGGLFTGDGASPRFSRIARSYLLRAGELDWKEINPDIFGSMIQAVADDGERGELGMHYTSVPNILKVLNPLFLDDLREQLAAAEGNARKLRNLRKRVGAIRVFDPACGSGNFLVIAYREMREIEAQIVARTGDAPKSWIKLDNFFGIEIRGFPAEIARLALLIAEFQADCRYLSQQEARSMVLPLHKTGQITVGNALRLDWLAVCPPARKAMVEEFDLGGPTGRLALEDNGLAEAAEPETYICGNPPYLGSRNQSVAHREDLGPLFEERISSWKSLDYVSGWLMKATDLSRQMSVFFAFVSTNSINQGLQVALLWPLILEDSRNIIFAHRSFKWSNLAANNAGVTVSIVGVGPAGSNRQRRIYDDDAAQDVKTISPYLIASDLKYVEGARTSISDMPEMVFGNMPRDGGHLNFSASERAFIISECGEASHFIFAYLGSDELINGIVRYCFWIDDAEADAAKELAPIHRRLEAVRNMRLQSSADSTKDFAERPHRFVQSPGIGRQSTLAIAGVSSERRSYLPIDLVDQRSVVSNLLFAMFDAPLWNMALIASRIHLVWIATVCGKLETRYRYSNTLGWNTFPVPPLTERNKADLTRCAEDILLAREAHFPATIADLYDPVAMPDDLRRAHEANDETLERIYIGRRFRNDTERLETLFGLYTKMTADSPAKAKRRPSVKGRAIP